MAISGYWYDAAIMESATKSTYNSYKINDLPFTSKSDLGVWSVSGRIRSPRPAARIIAFK
jgi:hypothetical protein